MFEQVKLDYAFDALEPHIDTMTMETHYGKHHATYTKNFNDAVEKAGLGEKSVEEILSSLSSVSDEALRNALQNNGGGFYNHNLYFSVMSPKREQNQALPWQRQSTGTLAPWKIWWKPCRIWHWGSLVPDGLFYR